MARLSVHIVSGSPGSQTHPSILVFDQRSLADSANNFFYAQVDCISNGDHCFNEGVKFYPSLFLYRDGFKIDEYEGARDLPALSAYVEEQLASMKEAESIQEADAVETEEAATLKFEETARSITGEAQEVDIERGTVRSLDRAKLHSIRSSKTRGSFVKFFAPWQVFSKSALPPVFELTRNSRCRCSHCKHLNPR